MNDCYDFRPTTAADLPMLRTWLDTPEVMRWWGDPDEQEGLLREDLDEPGMTMWIVSHDGHPFGYAQYYEVHRWPQPHFQAMPANTVATTHSSVCPR
jgi:aminoglycoside 6'-N-acetyltransferase